MIREIHNVLLSKEMGRKATEEFRRSQNWIGGAGPATPRFVPPPPEFVLECMSNLEIFLHEDRRDLASTPQGRPRPSAGETIHPFLDGNGQLGRLLVTFLLCVIREPFLYLSL